MIRVFQSEDYEKLAKNVVNDFIEKEIPLADGVLKVASEMDMGPEHLRNLVQISNKMAHLRLFEKKAEDKFIEFEPADPRKILKAMFAKMSSETEKTAADEGYDRDADFFGEFSMSSEETTKEAETTEPLSEEKLEHPHKRDISLLALRKTAEDLHSRKLQAEFGYLEEMDKLAAEFAKLYGPDYDVFEKDALYHYGEVTVPILGDIRSRLRMPEINIGSSDTTKKLARLVDTGTSEMKSLRKLFKFAGEAARCERGHAYLKQELGDAL